MLSYKLPFAITKNIQIYASFSEFASFEKQLQPNYANIVSEASTQPELSKTSLVTESIYEGGLDEWECEQNLIQYLQLHYTDIIYQVACLNLVELGCGCAKTALHIAENRAKKGLSTKMILQDLNIESFEYAAAKLAKLSDVEAHFIVCSWNEMAELFRNNKLVSLLTQKLHCQIFISADTMYRPSNVAILMQLFRFFYKVNTLVIFFLSQKRFYFGLGGGSAPFLSYLSLFHKDVKTSILQSKEKSNANILDIFTLNFCLPP